MVNGTLKHIIVSVLILVIALWIFSYFFNPYTRLQTQSYIQNIKSNVQSQVKEISKDVPYTAENKCIQEASKLIPNYLFLSNNLEVQVKNFWQDGSEMEYEHPYPYGDFSYSDLISMNKFRSGTNEEENVNYLYLEVGEFVYSKKIIDGEGNVLGTNSFSFKPILKESKCTFEIIGDARQNVKISQEMEAEYTIGWNGITDELKEIFNSDNITVQLIEGSSGYNRPICKEESIKESSGEYTCDLNDLTEEELDFVKKQYWYEGENEVFLFRFKPEIRENQIYEVVDYEFTSCSWIT